MATRSCPTCGTQYVATVRRCIDCDELLVDDGVAEAGEASSSAAPVGDGGQVGYELAGWGNQLKVTLEGMLDRAGIPRAWEAGALLVPASQEAAVDALIATVEGDDAAVLDEAESRVALEIEGLDADERAELDARLLAGGVAHVWDDSGDLVVSEADEDHVISMIEDLFEVGVASEGDELANQQALSSLYVAVDRLVKNPHDRKLATRFQEAATDIDGLPVPYGFTKADWADLQREVAALADRVEPHSDLVASNSQDEDLDDRGDDDSGDDDSGDDDPSEDARNDEAPSDSTDGDDFDEMSDLERDKLAAQELRSRLSDLV